MTQHDFSFNQKELENYLHGGCHGFAAAANLAYPQWQIFGLFSYRLTPLGNYPCLDHAFLYNPVSGLAFDALGVRIFETLRMEYWTGRSDMVNSHAGFLREVSPHELFGWEDFLPRSNNEDWKSFHIAVEDFNNKAYFLSERIKRIFGENIALR